MASIAQYLQAIMNAVYGEEVRGSIHDAIDAINTESTGSRTIANTANTNASNAVSTANTANTNASNAVSTANGAVTTVNNKLTEINTAISNANTATASVGAELEAFTSMNASVTGLAAGASPTISYGKTGGVYHLDFGIPKGDKGDTGDTGSIASMTIGTVSTLTPEQSATVTISGTAANPVLNFGLPRGRDGSITDDQGHLIINAASIPLTENDSTTIYQAITGITAITNAQIDAILV